MSSTSPVPPPSSNSSLPLLPSLTVTLTPTPSPSSGTTATTSSSSALMSRLLRVPHSSSSSAVTITTSSAIKDTTPTPDRLVREIEESGLLQDLRNHNPFDETFRKAAARNAEKDQNGEADEKATDTLNTPQILASLDTPTLISSLLSRQVSTTTASSSRQTTAARSTSSSLFVPIAPARTEPFQQLQQQAQLMLRLPSGDAIHLSDLPVIKETIASKLITTPVASASRTNRGAT